MTTVKKLEERIDALKEKLEKVLSGKAGGVDPSEVKTLKKKVKRAQRKRNKILARITALEEKAVKAEKQVVAPAAAEEIKEAPEPPPEAAEAPAEVKVETETAEAPAEVKVETETVEAPVEEPAAAEAAPAVEEKKAVKAEKKEAKPKAKAPKKKAAKKDGTKEEDAEPSEENE